MIGAISGAVSESKMNMKKIELKGVCAYLKDENTIKIFGREPKFATSISNDPKSVRYHEKLFKRLMEEFKWKAQ